MIILEGKYVIQGRGFVKMSRSILEVMRYPASRNGIWVLSGSAQGLRKKKLSEAEARRHAAWERKMKALSRKGGRRRKKRRGRGKRGR